MSYFRKKNIPIRALQYNGKNYWELYENFVKNQYSPFANLPLRDNGNFLTIIIKEGELYLTPGNWLAQAVEGELYPIEDRIFKKTYEKMDEE